MLGAPRFSWTYFFTISKFLPETSPKAFWTWWTGEHRSVHSNFTKFLSLNSFSSEMRYLTKKKKRENNSFWFMFLSERDWPYFLNLRSWWWNQKGHLINGKQEGKWQRERAWDNIQHSNTYFHCCFFYISSRSRNICWENISPWRNTHTHIYIKVM